ncbi:MAG: hypothetical protein AB7G37_07680 [Solirubrobacteraceae bacterium]
MSSSAGDDPASSPERAVARAASPSRPDPPDDGDGEPREPRRDAHHPLTAGKAVR